MDDASPKDSRILPSILLGSVPKPGPPLGQMAENPFPSHLNPSITFPLSFSSELTWRLVGIYQALLEFPIVDGASITLLLFLFPLFILYCLMQLWHSL